MATTIPVPIEFSLPEGWVSAPPDEVGASEAAFVALHRNTSNGFTANITIAGEVRTDDAPLPQIADEAVEKLRRQVGDVQVGRRNEVGTPDNPGLTQAVRTRVNLKGQQRDLVQFQVFLGMDDINDAHRRAVLHIVLTSTPEQFEKVIGDFQKFLETVRPEQGEAR